MSSAPACSASLRPSPWAQGWMLVQPMVSSSTTSFHTPSFTLWRYSTLAPNPPVAMITALALTVTSWSPLKRPLTPTTAPASSRMRSVAWTSLSTRSWSAWAAWKASNERM